MITTTTHMNKTPRRCTYMFTSFIQLQHMKHRLILVLVRWDARGDKEIPHRSPLGGLLVTRCCRGDPARCLQQVRVIIIPSSLSSSSDPTEQHAWSPVRLEAAAAVVDDHVAMMAEDPNTRNEVPTGAGIQCRWTRTTTQQCIIGNDMMDRAQDDDDDGCPHHSSSS